MIFHSYKNNVLNMSKPYRTTLSRYSKAPGMTLGDSVCKQYTEKIIALFDKYSVNNDLVIDKRADMIIKGVDYNILHKLHKEKDVIYLTYYGENDIITLITLDDLKNDIFGIKRTYNAIISKLFKQ